MRELTDDHYRTLLEFRTGIRRFQRWSEERASEAGLTPAQHQLLLAIRGHGSSKAPTIGEVAEYLCIRHHSAVELIDRAESAGLIRRRHDPDDLRVVRVELCATGERKLRELSERHLEEIARLAPRFRSLWSGLDQT